MSLSTNNQMQVLMDVNNLQYSPPIDGSLANTRQLKKYAYSPQVYTAGGAPQMQINSGGDFISGPTSFTIFTIVVKAFLVGTETPTTAGWNKVGASSSIGANGSAFNIIREHQISHRSGDVIDRTDALNSLVAELVRYAFDSSYSEKFAKVFGYGDTSDLVARGPIVYALPMFLFSGLYAQKALIPSHLIAGARLKLQLESAKVALVSDVLTNVVTYDITDMNLVLDSIDLFDAAKKSLMEQASNTRTQGLQYPFYSWFQLRKTSSDTSLNFDINLSAAKTMILLIKSRPSNIIDESKSQVSNSMACDVYPYTRWRARIGSHTMPQHEIESSAESYIVTQEAFSANPDCDLLFPSSVNCGVGYDTYSSPTLDAGAVGSVVSTAIVAISMEKNTIVALSGELTNATRLLNFTATLNAIAPGTSRVFDAYVKHLRVANSMLDNCVIDK
jgi:hypothetical protein